MIRVQTYLDEDDDLWLEERAHALGTSKAALIREGIHMLRTDETPPERDPLMDLVGHIKGSGEGPDDTGLHHDWYLTQWELDGNRWQPTGD